MERKMRMQLAKEALKSAKIAREQAKYLSECGGNAGIRKIYGDKANWLSVLIYFAEIGMRKEGEG